MPYQTQGVQIVSNVVSTPLVLRHWHTRIECDFRKFYHRVYFLNVRLKSWLSILLIFFKFFSRHFTFSPGGSAKLTCVCDENTAEQVIISNQFLSVKVMGEDSENLESALRINLLLLMQEVNFLSEKTSSDKRTEGSSVFQELVESASNHRHS